MNGPGYARFDSEAGYRAAIETAIGRARRELRIVDHDLRRMGLDGKDRVGTMEHYLVSGGHLSIVIHDAQGLVSMPRMLALLERQSHAMQVRIIPDDLKHLADCQVLVDGAHAVRRFHRDHPRGAVEFDAAEEIRPWWQRFDELWEQSTPWSPPRL